MRRREFIILLGGAATIGWAHPSHAQQPLKVHRIAIVHPSALPRDMSETGDILDIASFSKSCVAWVMSRDEIWLCGGTPQRGEENVFPSSPAKWCARSRILFSQPQIPSS